MPQIPDMTRELARKIVRQALDEVADIQGDPDIEQFTFQHFTDYPKSVFLTALKLALHSVKDDQLYYDIVLNPDSISHWPTIGDCVNYVLEQHLLCRAGTKKIVF